MSNIGQELLKIKEKLEKDKTEKAELQGELRSLTKQLQDEFGVDTMKKAEQLLATLGEKADDLAEQVQNGIEEIQAMLEETPGEDE